MNKWPSEDDQPLEPPEQIRCVECGGIAHLLDFAPEEGFERGDVLAYRCEDCLERWDIEL